MPAIKELTAAQIKAEIQRVQELIAKQKSMIKDEHFTSITPEEIEKKLKRAISPMIVGQSWANSALEIRYFVTIKNPDAGKRAGPLYVQVWVGSGGVDPTIGTFLLNVDTRFPRLMQPKDDEWLDPGASVGYEFILRAPDWVEKTNYLCNCCLMQIPFFDEGLYLDRSTFFFNVR